MQHNKLDMFFMSGGCASRHVLSSPHDINYGVKPKRLCALTCHVPQNMLYLHLFPMIQSSAGFKLHPFVFTLSSYRLYMNAIVRSQAASGYRGSRHDA